MKKISAVLAMLVLAASLTLSGCSASKKGGCGCPSQNGMAGYNFK